MNDATFTEHDWYNTPAYYDIIFDAGTAMECDFLEGVAQQFGKSGGKSVLEPACGSGRLVEEMAARGYTVSGFDLNDAMLDFARTRLKERGLKASLTRDAMQSFSYAKRFDLAHCLVSTFKYLLAEQAATAHLQCVAECLKPGGVYALGFHLSDYDDLRRSRERWFGRKGNLQVTCNIQSWPPDRRTRLEKIRSRVVVQQRRQIRRMETHWEFRTYNAAQVRKLLARVPALEHVATYDFDYNLEKPRRLDDERLDTLLVLRRV